MMTFIKLVKHTLSVRCLWTHTYRRCEKAWILNMQTSGVVNLNMKRRGKSRALTVFVTFSAFTKRLSEKYSKRLVLLNVGGENMVNI